MLNKKKRYNLNFNFSRLQELKIGSNVDLITVISHLWIKTLNRAFNQNSPNLVTTTLNALHYSQLRHKLTYFSFYELD